MSENIKMVQVSSDSSPVELRRECILKSVIIQSTGTDPKVELFDSISAQVSGKRKVSLIVDASVQGYMTPIPLWDLYFEHGVYVDIDNGVAWLIYETGQKSQQAMTGARLLKGSKVVHVLAATSGIGQQVTGPAPITTGAAPKQSGEITTLKGIILQGSGSDVELRVWDYAYIYADGPGRQQSANPPEARALDLKIDATYQGYCVPIDCHDLVFNKGIYTNLTNGDAFFIFEQDEQPK